LPNLEPKIGVVRDVILPIDTKSRYDLYFTDHRIAIVCMGKASRFEADSLEVISVLPPAFAVPAPLQSAASETAERHTVEEEISKISLDDLLKLSEKSGFYTYDEIREVKMVFSRNSRFKVLSDECESKFAPNASQAEELLGLVLSIEQLRNKLAVAGKWNALKEIFQTYT
jgi:hypothetical protein